ncbi:hypothetical protein X798_00556 [Onchocerca flexuosa]|uniref:Uncharacterized protein n=1 Tax=Onchocerca flexuosa TaxID=387005 RepID=A0A238C639_9BILA|nr:hypothetical protein X798_00556 [Onchocerca flexuosa]
MTAINGTRETGRLHTTMSCKSRKLLHCDSAQHEPNNEVLERAQLLRVNAVGNIDKIVVVGHYYPPYTARIKNVEGQTWSQKRIKASTAALKKQSSIITVMNEMARKWGHLASLRNTFKYHTSISPMHPQINPESDSPSSNKFLQISETLRYPPRHPSEYLMSDALNKLNLIMNCGGSTKAALCIKDAVRTIHNGKISRQNATMRRQCPGITIIMQLDSS